MALVTNEFVCQDESDEKVLTPHDYHGQDS